MAVPVEHRAFCAGLEVRSEGRTIAGLAVPFDEVAVVAGYRERFARGAFARTIEERGPGRVKLLAQHDRDRLPVGRATLLREDTAGLYAELTVAKTAAGDEVLELVRDGTLDGLSIGFRPIRDRWDAERSEVERLEVALLEVSAVAFPAYDSARVVAVRDGRPSIRVVDALARLDGAPCAVRVSVADARRRLFALEEFLR